MTDAEVEAIVAEIRSAYDLANETLQNFRSDRLDPDVAAESGDFDAQGILDWTVENVRWVPYHGLLKGAAGTLASRQGNSLDRALLLSELLAEAGYVTRLAHATLDAELAASMFDQASAVQVPDGVPVELSDTGEALVGRVKRQVEDLAKVIGAPPPPDLADLRATMADHWWVQAEAGSGWLDLDPMFPGDTAAQRPQPVSYLSGDSVPESLPDALKHRVTVRIVIERVEEGRLVEEVPLSHTLVSSDAVTRSLDIDFIPFGAEAPDDDAWQVDIRKVAETALDWLPVIHDGDDRIMDQGFNNAGQLEKNPAKPIQQRKLDTAASALSGIGANADDAKPKPVLTAAWIEYALEGPGRPVSPVRRQLFDILPPGSRGALPVPTPAVDGQTARRRGLSLLGRSQVLVFNSEPPLEMFDRGMLRFWGETGNLIAGMVRVAQGTQEEEPRERLANGRVEPLDLLTLAVFRGLLTPYAGTTYLDRPNIVGNHFVYTEEGSGPFHATDIVLNTVAGFPLSFAAQLHQGVLDTNLEASLADAGETQHNTAVLFERTPETGAWRRVLASDLDDAYLTPQVRERLRGALRAERMVIAPPRLPTGARAAWWELDMANGTLLGIGPYGWGANLVERAGVHVVPAQVRAAQAKSTGQAVCTGIGVAATAVQLMVPERRGYAILTPQSIRAQARPLLRRHCLVQGWWRP